MPKRLPLYLLMLAFLALVSLQGSAFAAAGSLDPSFGKGGRVLTALNHCGLGVCNIEPAGALLQNDGKIVVALNSVFAGMIRYLTDGAVDTTFGTRGVATTVNGIGTTNAMTVQPDGKFVIAGLIGGSTSDSFTVVRYDSNGTVDPAFGANGLSTVTLNGRMGVGEAILIQPDGKILVGATALEGHLGIPETALARFNSDGTVDSTFGNVGTVLGAAVGGVDALAVLTDGDILVVNRRAIAQFTSTGTLEMTVTGGSPVVSSRVGIFTADGHFFDPETVATGKHLSGAQVFEFNPDGTTDTSFNNPMFAFISGGMSSASSTDFQTDSKIVVGGGHCAPGFTPCLDGLARLDTNGGLDSSFGNGGLVTTEFTGSDLGYSVVLVQTVGSIVGIGTSLNTKTGQANLALGRYLAD